MIGVLWQPVVAHTGVVLLLVPAGPLRPRRADEHFAAEAAAARDAGHDVALANHDALAEPGGAGRAVARVRDGGGAVYRGWMLASGRYAALAEALAARGVTLHTSAGQYRRAHELPGWYPALAPVTPAAVWTAGDGEEEFRAACERLGPGPAVLHEEEFTGGFVLRRFERFTSAEARTWWAGGTCRLVTAHPDTPGNLPPEFSPAPYTALIGSLGLPFVAADLAPAR